MRLTTKFLLRSSLGLSPFRRRIPSPSIAAASSAPFHASAAPPQLQQVAAVAPGVATAGTPSLLDLCNDPHFVELGRRPSDRVLRIADEMISLTVLEVSDVGDLLKKKLKIGNMPMMGFGMGGGMPAGSGTATGEEAAEEKKKEKLTFNVKLEKFDTAAKIKIIKEIRAFTSLGLKEAKELVEKVPTLVKTGISKEEATDIVAKLTAAGATVVME